MTELGLESRQSGSAAPSTLGRPGAQGKAGDLKVAATATLSHETPLPAPGPAWPWDQEASKALGKF